MLVVSFIHTSFTVTRMAALCSTSLHRLLPSSLQWFCPSSESVQAGVRAPSADKCDLHHIPGLIHAAGAITILRDEPLTVQGWPVPQESLTSSSAEIASHRLCYLEPLKHELGTIIGSGGGLGYSVTPDSRVTAVSDYFVLSCQLPCSSH